MLAKSLPFPTICAITGARKLSKMNSDCHASANQPPMALAAYAKSVPPSSRRCHPPTTLSPLRSEALSALPVPVNSSLHLLPVPLLTCLLPLIGSRLSALVLLQATPGCQHLSSKGCNRLRMTVCICFLVSHTFARSELKKFTCTELIILPKILRNR